MLYPWGDDHNQTSDPSMSFMNPAWDGKRGIRGDVYRDYIPPGRLVELQTAAAVVRDGIWAVRGQSYVSKQGFDLYPTSGTSEDWAFAREFEVPARGKLTGMVIEFNKNIDFFPTWPEMVDLIADVDAGLIALCKHATPSFWAVWWCLLTNWLKKRFWVLWHRVFPPELWGPYGPWTRIVIGIQKVVSTLGRSIAGLVRRVIGRG